MKFLLGRKIGMSQIFDEKGNVVPVTLIEAGPCFITQVKTKDGKDKYDSLQIGFENLKEKKVKKSQRKKPYRYLREFKGDIDFSKYKPQDQIDVSIFQPEEKVAISGISKGKGYAGVIKRWGFKSKPATHGQKHEERAQGSVGSRFPQRVIKGRKMSGRLGAERTTVKNLKIAKIDLENNLLAVKGAIPGRKGTLLEIRG